MAATITTLSDPSVIWIVNNQQGQKDTIKTLKELPPRGTVYAGVGCLANLDFVSARLSNPDSQITSIVIFDCSKKVEQFWQKICPFFQWTDPDDFYLDLVRLMHTQREHYFEYSDYAKKQYPRCTRAEYALGLYNAYTRKLQLDKYSGISFLSKEHGQYQKIRQIFQNGGFRFASLNVCDPQKTEPFIKLLNDLGSLDTFYISNILECLLPEKRAAYARFLCQLPPSIYITAETLSPRDLHPTQCVYSKYRPRTYPTAAFLQKLKPQYRTAQSPAVQAPTDLIDLKENQISIPIQFVDYFGNPKSGSRIVCTPKGHQQNFKEKLDSISKITFPLIYCDSLSNRSFQEVDIPATQKQADALFAFAAQTLKTQKTIEFSFECQFAPESFWASPILKSAFPSRVLMKPVV